MKKKTLVRFTKKEQRQNITVFNSQRVGYHLNQKLLYQYISIQNISSIHTVIAKIEQILGSHELKSHSPFWPKPGKNHWINFYLSWVCTSMQKSVYSICSFLKYRPLTRLATPILTMPKQKKFQSPFNLHAFQPASKKSVHSILGFIQAF